MRNKINIKSTSSSYFKGYYAVLSFVDNQMGLVFGAFIGLISSLIIK